MAHSFKVAIKDNLPTTLESVEKTIIAGGGEFKGDVSEGGFSGKTILGKVHGKYTALSEDEVEITITKKPLAAPYSRIESAIKEYFAA